jgi:hypothetical protein
MTQGQIFSMLGRKTILNRGFKASPDYTAPSKFRVGTGQGAPLITDNTTDIKLDPVLQISFSADYPTISEPTATGTFRGPVLLGEANGNSISEYCLYNSDSPKLMLMRGIFNPITKTDKVSILFTERDKLADTALSTKYYHSSVTPFAEGFGTGADGVLNFTTTTKTYGNLTLHTDYEVSGNTLYLKLNRTYNFTYATIGAGCTLSTDDTAGATMQIYCTFDATIAGTVALNGGAMPNIPKGPIASTSYGGLTTPNVTASGGNGGNGDGMNGNGGTGAVGYAGGGGGGLFKETNTLGEDVTGTGGTGGNGSATTTGGVAGSTSLNYNIPTNTYYTQSGSANGSNAAGNGGGGGGAGYWYRVQGTSVGRNMKTGENKTQASAHVTQGDGGAAGTAGYAGYSEYAITNANLNEMWHGGAGGGGGGGTSGITGINFILKCMNLYYTGAINTSGSAGGNGGAGGSCSTNDNVINTLLSVGCVGTGGGGGGGAGGNGGAIQLTYANNLTNTGTSTYNGGAAGTGGGTGASNHLNFSDFGASSGSNGGASTAGSFTLILS